VVGLILGPLAIAGAAAGAALGALTEKLHDAGLDDDKLKALGEGLKAGTGAVVALTDANSSATVTTLLKDAGASMVMEGLNQFTLEKLMSAQ
jgi:uncharacterized membrane protein